MEKENTNGVQPEIPEIADDDFHLLDHRRPEMKNRPDLRDGDTEKVKALDVEMFVDLSARGIVAGVLACDAVASV